MSDGFFAPGFFNSLNNKKQQSSSGISELTLDSIVIDPQVRKTFKDEQVTALAQSINKLGCIEPIVVWGPDVACGRKYHLICGELRYRAHQLLGKTAIRAVIIDKPQSQENLQLLQVAENYSRSSLSAFEVADALATLRNSMDITELKAIFSLKSTAIYGYLQISALDERERRLLGDKPFVFLLKYCNLKKTRPQKARALLRRLEKTGEGDIDEKRRSTDEEHRAMRLKKYQNCLKDIKNNDDDLYRMISRELKNTGESAQELIVRALRLLLQQDAQEGASGGMI